MTADHDLVSIVWMAVIVISYSLAVCLDYLSQVKQLKVFKQSGEIGKSFVVRGKIALISRGCAFLLAPMLGILLARGVSSGDLLMLFWFNSLLAVLYVLVMFMLDYSYFFSDAEEPLFGNFRALTYAQMTLGALCFSVLVNVFFITNVIASFFMDHSLWIVQLTGIINALATTYIIFIYDVRISKRLDSSALGHNDIIIFLSERILGRVLTFTVLSILLLYFG